MALKKNFHTIIVGAGPGGLSCATMLAQKGLDVLVLERSKKVGPKVCAGGVTWSGLARHLPDHLIEKAFSRQHIRCSHQKTVVASKNPIISTVNRDPHCHLPGRPVQHQHPIDSETLPRCRIC